MRSIFEVARELNLSSEDFRRLVDEGILEDCRLDESCLQKVRAAYLAEQPASRKPKH
jgi:hypothetical protein